MVYDLTYCCNIGYFYILPTAFKNIVTQQSEGDWHLIFTATALYVAYWATISEAIIKNRARTKNGHH